MGRRGEGLWRWGEREIMYLSLHCRHQNDSCIKMGSDDSHFNVSLIVRDKVTKQCLQTTTFEDKGEPKRIRTEVPLLTNLPARPNRLTHIHIQKDKKDAPQWHAYPPFQKLVGDIVVYNLRQNRFVHWSSN